MSTKTNLPTIADLTSDLENYEKQDKLNYLLNQPVPKAWVKSHPIIKKEVVDENGLVRKVPYEYLPIDKVEYLLRRIFKSYKIEILREGALFNSVFCTVRVHYKNVTTGEWDFHDGTGAWSLQLNKGAQASDLNAIKSGAVTMALPLAKTLAIKDACDLFGNLFGANLNRTDIIEASLDEGAMTNESKLAKIKELLKSDSEKLTPEEEKHVNRIIQQKEFESYGKVIALFKQLNK